MYRLSKKEMYIKKTNVNTPGNAKIKFKLMSKCTGNIWVVHYTEVVVYGIS